MKKRELQACIFDLDGVIVDTPKYHFQAWRRLAKGLGMDLTENLNEQLKGASRIDSLNLILQWSKTKKTPAEKELLCDKKNDYYLELIEDLDSRSTYLGVEDVLKSLQSIDIKIGLGSASKNAVKVLERLNLRHYFQTIVDGNMVQKGKPNPETFLLACQHLSVNPEQTIVFEDAPKGVDAANSGNMLSVGIGSPDLLGHADLVIDGFEFMGIHRIVNKLGCFEALA